MGRGDIWDVHHHYVPREVLDAIRPQQAGQVRLVDSRLSLTFDARLSDLDAHLRDMDRAGIAGALLSNASLSLQGIEACRRLNDGTAAAVAAHPDRFAGALHLSLEDPEESLEECRRAREGLGLEAVALVTSQGSVQLDDPRLFPIYEQIEGYGLPIFLHPALRPQGFPSEWGMERSVGRTFDTTQAAFRLLHGVLPHFPRLTFILPHCGGALAFLRGRIGMFYEPPGLDLEPALRQRAKTRAEQAAAGIDTALSRHWDRFYVDLAGTGAWSPALRLTAEAFAPERLIFGCDYPLECKTPENLSEAIAAVAGLPAAQSGPGDTPAPLWGGTLLRLLGR